MQVNQNITPFFGGKSTGRTCTICSQRFNQKSLGMKYLILMAARQDDKGNGEKMKLEITDFRLKISEFRDWGIEEFNSAAIGQLSLIPKLLLLYILYLPKSSGERFSRISVHFLASSSLTSTLGVESSLPDFSITFSST